MIDFAKVIEKVRVAMGVVLETGVTMLSHNLNSRGRGARGHVTLVCT